MRPMTPEARAELPVVFTQDELEHLLDMGCGGFVLGGGGTFRITDELLWPGKFSGRIGISDDCRPTVHLSGRRLVRLLCMQHSRPLILAGPGSFRIAVSGCSRPEVRIGDAAKLSLLAELSAAPVVRAAGTSQVECIADGSSSLSATLTGAAKLRVSLYFSSSAEVTQQGRSILEADIGPSGFLQVRGAAAWTPRTYLFGRGKVHVSGGLRITGAAFAGRCVSDDGMQLVDGCRLLREETE